MGSNPPVHGGIGGSWDKDQGALPGGARTEGRDYLATSGGVYLDALITRTAVQGGWLDGSLLGSHCSGCRHTWLQPPPSPRSLGLDLPGLHFPRKLLRTGASCQLIWKRA